MIKNVAFIGLGNMGAPLSRHLLNAGFNVSGYDVVKEKMSALEADGLRAASSPADAARDADAILTMLMRPEIIRDVLYGEQGVVHGAKDDLDGTVEDYRRAREIGRGAMT